MPAISNRVTECRVHGCDEPPDRAPDGACAIGLCPEHKTLWRREHRPHMHTWALTAPRDRTPAWWSSDPDKRERYRDAWRGVVQHGRTLCCACSQRIRPRLDSWSVDLDVMRPRHHACPAEQQDPAA
ncbi:hypothetical protein [Nocardioides ungokensis]|uniref:hypothetical protein n=1 Tax=Nocardioides ungokensis TaxID=1643322 RepID=UPI0015DD7885|nr:hypothetical protein [Nocardioides ungokensis]